MENFELCQKLGSGTYGHIYRGRHKVSEKQVAIKIEHPPVFLQSEYRIYRYLWSYLRQEGDSRDSRDTRKTLNIPEVYCFDADRPDHHVLVLEELHYSLDYLYISLGNRFSFPMIIWLTVRGLEQLRELHRLGILHRDIKPDNFGIKKNRLYLIDFGLARQYIHGNGSHIEQKTGLPLIGTKRYASMHNHKGIEQSRRDDLESFWYTVLFLQVGTLPWLNTASPEEILLAKESLDVDAFCRDVPVQYAQLYKYIHDLSFDEKPEYDMWIREFQGLLPAGSIMRPDKKPTKRTMKSPRQFQKSVT